jgi:hypothetical protein
MVHKMKCCTQVTTFYKYYVKRLSMNSYKALSIQRSYLNSDCSLKRILSHVKTPFSLLQTFSVDNNETSVMQEFH